MIAHLSRRAMIGDVAKLAAALALPAPLFDRLGFRTPAHPELDRDRTRFDDWTWALRTTQLVDRDVPVGRAAARVGELAIGTPYVAQTLEARLRPRDATGTDPLILSLTRFDCISLVESCIAVARAARAGGAPSWKGFSREVERMRYRHGIRGDYTTRLHYFSEWIAEGDRRCLLRDLTPSLGGVEDRRPLRYMTQNRDCYPALGDDRVFGAIETMERRLDRVPRRVIPTACIAEVAGEIQTGDVLGFATSTPGLDVSHCALAYRDRHGVLGVLHAPMSGGAVEVSTHALPEYVSRLRGATGIMVARAV
jgi:hypothetical protein